MLLTFDNSDIMLLHEPLSFMRCTTYIRLILPVCAGEQAAKLVQHLLDVSVRRHFALLLPAVFALRIRRRKATGRYDGHRFVANLDQFRRAHNPTSERGFSDPQLQVSDIPHASS